MAQKLPQEIVDLVVCEFSTDDRAGKRTVAQCGLVCKNWFPSSRYRLFANVDLNDHTVRPFLSVVDKSPFPIPSVIRSLGLSFSGNEGEFSLEESLRQLGPLRLVTTLRMTLKHDILIQNSTLLENTFPGISTLVFRNVPLPVDSVLRTISSFPLLKSVELDWVRLSYDTVSSKYQLPRLWNSLILDLLTDRSKDSQPIFAEILSLDPMPVLSSLSVREIDPTESSPFGKYLSRIGNALHHLRLESGATHFFSLFLPLFLYHRHLNHAHRKTRSLRSASLHGP